MQVRERERELDNNGNHKLIQGQCTQQIQTKLLTHTHTHTHTYTHTHTHAHTDRCTHRHTHIHTPHSKSNEVIYRKRWRV